MQQIKYEGFNWGPLLLKTYVDVKICDQILLMAKNAKDDHRDGLASLIDNAKKFNLEDKDKIFQLLYPFFMCFIDLQDNHLVYKSLRPTQLKPGDLWINYQTAGEFNPPHRHNMDLSFALCLQMPQEIIQENKNYLGRSSGPGALMFNYGEIEDCVIHTHQFLPKKGDLFLFPSKLRHTVFPFKSNTTRISISGNLGYIYD